MNKELLAFAGIFSLVLLLAVPACDVKNPDRYLRPPVIKSYSPGNFSLRAAVGDTMEFSIAAIDPDDQDLRYYFMLGDSVAANSQRWTYVVGDTGDVEIQGRVSDGLSESLIRWQMTRVWPVNLPPVIVHFDPPDPEITIIVGSSIEFTVRAEDPEGKPLSYVYTVDDSLAGVSRWFRYHATFVGMVEVKAVVSDGETFASHSWGLRIAAEPDSIPPAQVTITLLEPGVETGEINVEWIAVGDDSMSGLPAHYIVRTSGKPMTDEESWAAGSDRPGEPDPAAPGTVQGMVIQDLNPAQLVHVAVRAIDDFGNLSAISEPISTRSRGMKIRGTVRDAVTNEPLPGIEVILTSAVDTTDSDGSYVLSELPAGSGKIFLYDEKNHATIGDYFDIIVNPYEIVDKDVVDLWMIPDTPLESELYENLLIFFQVMARVAGAEEDVLGTWETPCKVHVPPLVHNNLDYEQTVKDIFIEWEDLIGVDVFEFVESVPDTGVFVEYADDIAREHYRITVWDELGLPVQGAISLRTLHSDTTLAIFQVIVRHEVGHALGMNHSADELHIMIGGRFPAVTVPSPDEINLGKVMYHTPRLFNFGWHRQD
ncbi:MAG: hypothetical protein JSW58_01520 [Candidatus Latescibacterota bacterium]|nr:MAG: hypothetical protein JSW58_01520 [Candidatus Latescibacterota bacterium]